MKTDDANELEQQMAARIHESGLLLLQALISRMNTADSAALASQLEAGNGDVVVCCSLFLGELRLTFQTPGGESLLLGELALPSLTRVDDVPGSTVQ